MTLSVKKIVRKLLFKIRNPFLVYKLIPVLSKNNLYVDKSYLNKELFNLLKELNGFNEFSISTTGVLILFYKNDVVKIPLGKVSQGLLYKNYENYILLQNSKFKNFVDYRLAKKTQYYIMENLKNVVLSDKEVQKIVLKLSGESKKVHLTSLRDKLFKNLQSIEKLCKIKILFPDELEVESCPMHGDLTADNIMQNSKDKIVLIDLDRFTFEGIAEIDKFHYEVDKRLKELGMDFFDYVEFVINQNNEPCNENFFLYLIYRVSKEHHSNIFLDKNYYIKFQNFFNNHNLKSFTKESD